MATGQSAFIRHINLAKPRQKHRMGALANQAFVKMNGIGNEIVVVDMRTRGGKIEAEEARAAASAQDRKSTRLNSSHLGISYAVFCLKKKKKKKETTQKLLDTRRTHNKKKHD